MYPSGELVRVEARKQLLLRRIELRRTEARLLGGLISERVAVFDGWRDRIVRWAKFASTFFPYFRSARAVMKGPQPKGRVGRAFRWLRVALKIVRGLRPLTYAFRAG